MRGREGSGKGNPWISLQMRLSNDASNEASALHTTYVHETKFVSCVLKPHLRPHF